MLKQKLVLSVLLFSNRFMFVFILFVAHFYLGVIFIVWVTSGIGRAIVHSFSFLNTIMHSSEDRNHLILLHLTREQLKR